MSLSGEKHLEEKECNASMDRHEDSDHVGSHPEQVQKQTQFEEHSDDETRRDSPPKLRIKLPEGTEVTPTHSETASFETLHFKGSSLKESNSNDTKGTQPSIRESRFSFVKKLSPRFAWIRNNCDWPHLVPVIRGAVAAWLSLLLIIIQGAENIIGQVSILALNVLDVLVVSFI